MAKLLSEDKEVRTNLEIILLKDTIKSKINISWISYKLILQSGDKNLSYEKENDKGSGDYVFALTPVNEIENFISGIESFLKSKTSKMFSFEPLEPSFEIILERGEKGYAVHLWLDAGNVISNHFTWDGFGIRFFTNLENIELFINELKHEVEGLFQREPT